MQGLMRSERLKCEKLRFIMECNESVMAYLFDGAERSKELDQEALEAIPDLSRDMQEHVNSCEVCKSDPLVTG